MLPPRVSLELTSIKVPPSQRVVEYKLPQQHANRSLNHLDLGPPELVECSNAVIKVHLKLRNHLKTLTDEGESVPRELSEGS